MINESNVQKTRYEMEDDPNAGFVLASFSCGSTVSVVHLRQLRRRAANESGPSAKAEAQSAVVCFLQAVLQTPSADICIPKA